MPWSSLYGASGASLRELDDDAMVSSYVVAEGRACVERESGDILLSGAKVRAEIGEILADPSAARIPRDQRVVFKSVGMAIEDITAARLVWTSIEPQYRRTVKSRQIDFMMSI